MHVSLRTSLPTPRILLSSCAALLVASLTGCASLGAPDAASLAQVPVVRFGETAPTGDFILYYPAGVDLPVEARIHGSLLTQEARETLKVQVKQDVYTYKQWASLDGKTWLRGDKVIGGQYEIRVPGEQNGHNPGSLRAEFNLK